MYRSQLKVARSYVQQNSGSREEADDVFQDTILEAYEQVRKGHFRGESSLSTYVMSIMKKKWLNVLKRKQIHAKAAKHLIEEERYSEDRERSIRKAARILMDKAGADCQRLLSLVYFYDYSMEEAAGFVGLKNAQNARNKKRRCMQKIRTWLESDPHIATLFRVYV